MKLEYVDETHQYTIDGEPVPSVTQLLCQYGLIDRTWWTEEGVERGSMVHELTAMVDLNKVPADDYQYLGYLNAWEEFKRISGIVILAVEIPGCDRLGRYAGRADRIVKYEGKPYVLDIKTGTYQGWHGIQLLAYSTMEYLRHDMLTELPPPFGCLAVYLKPDGKYNAEMLTPTPKYRNVWESILTIEEFKRR